HDAHPLLSASRLAYWASASALPASGAGPGRIPHGDELRQKAPYLQGNAGSHPMSKQARRLIDGAVGTTGLEIRERLAGRSELSLITLPEAERKNAAARKAALNDADLVILCLPDEAAKEAVTLIDNPDVRVIDASSAHRVAPG